MLRRNRRELQSAQIEDQRHCATYDGLRASSTHESGLVHQEA